MQKETKADQIKIVSHPAPSLDSPGMTTKFACVVLCFRATLDARKVAVRKFLGSNTVYDSIPGMNLDSHIYYWEETIYSNSSIFITFGVPCASYLSHEEGVN